MPTLKELNVKPGDVVFNGKVRLRIDRVDNMRATGKTTLTNGGGLENDAWILDGHSDWQIESRAGDETPKPWDEMTDEEKAPILLAFARGEEVEWRDGAGKWFLETYDPRNWKFYPRRIKPKPEAPKRVETFIHWDEVSATCVGAAEVQEYLNMYGGHVYRITCNADGSDPQIEKVEV